MDNFYKVIEKSQKFIAGTIESKEKTKNYGPKIEIRDEILPIEYFMNIPNRMKSHKFYQDIKLGDVVVGCVTRVYQNRLEACLICTAGSLIREVEALKILLICRANELPVVSNFSSIKAFRTGDKVKAIISKITRNECLEISMNELSPMNTLRQTDLGLISDENLPSYFKLIQDSTVNKNYFNYAFPLSELSISMDIKNMLEYYNINDSGFSLLNDINGIKISESETAKSMRSALLMKESMKYVIKGVQYYKAKQLNEALQCYNHALSINEANVDALVARGALRASSKSFELSIEDLERAVKLDPNHKNAALYLSQTIVAYSKNLPEQDRTIAEDLVKNTFLTKDQTKSKPITNDIKDPNQFIIITDEDSNSSSQSSGSYKKRKTKKTKKQKSKMSKKTIIINSSSSEDRKHHKKRYVASDDSFDNVYANSKCQTSFLESNKKRKHYNDKELSKHNKLRHCSPSSGSDSSSQYKSRDRSINRSKHSIDKTDWRDIPDPMKHNKFRTNIQHVLNTSMESSHKRKARWDSGSDYSPESNHLDKVDRKLPRYLNQSFKYDVNAQSWSLHNDNNHNNDVSSVHKFKSVDHNNQRTSEFNALKKISNAEEQSSNIPDIIVSCDQENLKLKKANEDIKQIEDFISSLRQSVPL